MRKLLILILFLNGFTHVATAQEEDTTVNFTQLTASEFMNGRTGKSMNWQTVTASKIIIYCNHIDGIHSYQIKCSFLQWLGGVLSSGGGGCPCEYYSPFFDPTNTWSTNHGSPQPYVSYIIDDGGGPENGGGSGTNPPGWMPPKHDAGADHNDGGSVHHPDTVKTTLDDDDPNALCKLCPLDSTKGTKDCPKGAYKDSCGYCVGGTTGRLPCVCPTDSNFTVTKEMLLVINPLNKMKATDTATAKKNMDSVMKYINLYKDDIDFKINKRLRLAHLLAQLSVETAGFTKFAEAYNYSKKTLLGKKKFFDSTNVDHYVNCVCVFDKMYCCKYGNGDTASKDGSKYRGQGAIHLTWKENYEKFNTFYQNKYNDYTVNFKDNPELLQTNMKYATIAALWYVGKFKKLNDEADNDDVLSYSRGVNIGNPKSTDKPNNLPDRKNKLKLSKQALCL